MIRFYSLGLWVYLTVLRTVALWHPKAKAFFKSRRLNKTPEKSPKIGENLIQFHCASLGEFELAKKYILHYRSKGFRILLTFYSHSGFNVAKEEPDYYDFITYLPFDFKSQVNAFLKKWNPVAVIIISYEFWFNFLNACSLHQVPVIFMAVKLKSNHYNFRIAAFNSILKNSTAIFTKDESTNTILQEKGFNSRFLGDPRYTQAILNTKKEYTQRMFETIPKKEVIIYGSTWSDDHKIIVPFINRDDQYVHIIAPHEVYDKNIDSLKKSFGDLAIKLSEFDNQDLSLYKVIIIDRIGILKYLYRYADIAYIGGGFRTGLHNIIEAQAYGLGTLFGPNYQSYPEAKKSILLDISFSVKSSSDLDIILKDFDVHKEKVIEFVKSQMPNSEFLNQTIDKAIHAKT